MSSDERAAENNTFPACGRRRGESRMAEKILLVEDEEKLARMVELELRY